MNIAIIGSFDFHLECVSFILEQFRNDKVVVFIRNDPYRTLEYYKTLYSNEKPDQNLNYKYEQRQRFL